MRDEPSAPARHDLVRCSFCSHEFDEDAGRATCGRCALFHGCRMLRCPNCGYEMPQTPGLLRMLRRLRRDGVRGR